MSELPDVQTEQQTADIVVPAEQRAPEPAPQPVAPPKVRRFNIIGRRNIFFAISLLVIIPGIISMWHNHFLLGIDFAGGTEMTVIDPASNCITFAEFDDA